MSIRLDPRRLGTLKQLAAEAGVRPGDLVRQWVEERIDASRGEKVYMTSCATCHRLHGQGFDVGPNLGSVAGREKRALLTDMLDPNRAMAPQFQVYVVKTASGELLNGIVKAGKHEALADINESIAELKYYREHFLRI